MAGWHISPKNKYVELASLQWVAGRESMDGVVGWVRLKSVLGVTTVGSTVVRDTVGRTGSPQTTP